MPFQIRQLYYCIGIFQKSSNTTHLWVIFKYYISDDYLEIHYPNKTDYFSLKDMNETFKLPDLSLSTLTWQNIEFSENLNLTNNLVIQQSNYEDKFIINPHSYYSKRQSDYMTFRYRCFSSKVSVPMPFRSRYHFGSLRFVTHILCNSGFIVVGPPKFELFKIMSTINNAKWMHAKATNLWIFLRYL